MKINLDIKLSGAESVFAYTLAFEFKNINKWDISEEETLASFVSHECHVHVRTLSLYQFSSPFFISFTLHPQLLKIWITVFKQMP